MIKPTEQLDIITLADASRLLGYSLGYTYQIYHTWKERGVRFLKTAANSHPRFYRSDILKMMEACK